MVSRAAGRRRGVEGSPDPMATAARLYGRYLGRPALAKLSRHLFDSPHTLPRRLAGRYAPLDTAELVAFLRASGFDPGAFFDWALGQGLGTLDLYLWELTRINRHERRLAQNLVARNLGRRRNGSPRRSVLDETATPAARARAAWATLAEPGDDLSDTTELLEAWGVLANAARRTGRAVRAAVYARQALPELPGARPLYRGKFFQRLGYLAFHFSDHRCALRLIDQARDAYAEAKAPSHLGRCHVDAAQVYYHRQELDRALAEAEIADRALDAGEAKNRVTLQEVRILIFLERGAPELARQAWHRAMALGEGLGGLFREHLQMLDGRILLGEHRPALALDRLAGLFETAMHIEDKTKLLDGLLALVAAQQIARWDAFDRLFPRVRRTARTVVAEQDETEVRAFALAFAELQRHRVGEATRRVLRF